VPIRAIHQGEELAPSQFTARNYLVGGVARRTFVVSLDQLRGMEARATLRAGKPVALRQIGRVPAVRKGAQVNAVYHADGVFISAPFDALEDGSAGDTIRARNPATGLIVSAEVTADGALRLAHAP
jgi:flagella basal body P-ring formation protein FlgA